LFEVHAKLAIQYIQAFHVITMYALDGAILTNENPIYGNAAFLAGRLRTAAETKGLRDHCEAGHG
jgi:hypothetical protein